MYQHAETMGLPQGSKKISTWLYNKISIEQIYGEVYADCHDRMAKGMLDID